VDRDVRLMLRQFGARLTELRLDRDLSQQEFAELAGMTLSYYATIEQGKKNVTVGTLMRLAKAHALPWFELGKPPRPGPTRKRRPKRVR
jgi:transcriptional regulator with XRE-family HTH domain